MSDTEAEVFIIESLDIEDEDYDRMEGKRLADMLKMSGKACRYYYIRTRKELKAMLEIFKESNYRYLHISTHGSTNGGKFCGLWTTYDEITTNEVGKMLKPYIDKRRVFISACKAGVTELAHALMAKTKCHSVMAPHRKEDFAKLAIFWAAFYYAMFEADDAKMSNNRIRDIGTSVAQLFKLHMNLYTRVEDEIEIQELK